MTPPDTTLAAPDAAEIAQLSDLAVHCMKKKEHKPPVMYVWHNGRQFEAQDYFAHWGPIPYIRADVADASVQAAVAKAVEAERAECAEVAINVCWSVIGGREVAAAIRSRGVAG